ncbi:MAG: cation-translocating P-type ATPase [Nanoarchaeota archaeon]
MKKVQITLNEMEEDASGVEQSLSQLSGVRNVNANPSSKVIVADCEEYIAEDQLISTLRQGGYQVIDIFFEKSTENREIEEQTVIFKSAEKTSDWLENMIWSWVFAAPLIGLILYELFLGYPEAYRETLHIITLLLSLPIVFLMGWKVIYAGFQGFITLSFDTNTLITLSTVLAYATGIISIFLEITDYSSISGVMMAFFITGKYLETKVYGAAEKEVRKFTKLIPQSATIMIGKEELVVPLSEIQIGDLLIALPGDHIAADGVIVKGKGIINESAISRREQSQEKKQGDVILAGSVIEEGKLIIEVTKVGKDTILSKVVGMVEGVQSTKITIQRKINTVTNLLFPIMIILAAICFVSWLVFTQDFSKALNTALAVIIIACPSSLALAIPTVLFIASSLAARQGILVRNGESFQTLTEVRTIILDKSGTITQGIPEVSYISSLIKEKDLLEAAASVQHILDPLVAKCLLERAGLKRYKKVTNVTIIPGKGVEGEIDKKKVLVGNKKLMTEKAITFHGLLHRIDEYESSGKRSLIVAINGKIAGVIAISESLREDASIAINRLQKMNYNIILMTSEEEKTAKALAKNLNIQEIYHEVSAQETLTKIKELQNLGRVAFVSSPAKNMKALDQSNIGIVIGNESDVGHGTEDILITKSSISGVSEIAKFSRQVQRKINQNLFWAFGYNVLAIPLAVSGLLHPIIAELAMLASMLSIFINANLLRKNKF